MIRYRLIQLGREAVECMAHDMHQVQSHLRLRAEAEAVACRLIYGQAFVHTWPHSLCLRVTLAEQSSSTCWTELEAQLITHTGPRMPRLE